MKYISLEKIYKVLKVSSKDNFQKFKQIIYQENESNRQKNDG